MRVIRSLPTMLLFLGLVGCENFLGLGEDLNVTTSAVLGSQDNLIWFTVANRSSETIFLGQTFSLERREGNEWRRLPSPPMTLELRAPIPIQAGEDYAQDSRRGVGDRRLSAGEYRYNLDLWTEDKDRLPGDARISNVVRIK